MTEGILAVVAFALCIVILIGGGRIYRLGQHIRRLRYALNERRYNGRGRKFSSLVAEVDSLIRATNELRKARAFALDIASEKAIANRNALYALQRLTRWAAREYNMIAHGEERPFEPFDTLDGVISQVDHLCAALASQRDESIASLGIARMEVDANRELHRMVCNELADVRANVDRLEANRFAAFAQGLRIAFAQETLWPTPQIEAEIRSIADEGVFDRWVAEMESDPAPASSACGPECGPCAVAAAARSEDFDAA